MLNRAGYQRIFIEAVRHRGEAFHVRQIRGGGVRRDELSQADLWDEDYDPGELVFPDNKQRVCLTWLASPLVYGGRLFFLCPDCERRCCELFRSATRRARDGGNVGSVCVWFTPRHTKTGINPRHEEV